MEGLRAPIQRTHTQKKKNVMGFTASTLKQLKGGEKGDITKMK